MFIATSRDVASQAGVSIKTVSNVVNGVTSHVSEETADRVRRAIVELGYRPNLTARRLRTGRSRMLALVVPDLRNPYFAQVAATSIRVARSFGYNVFIEETGDDPEAELSASRGFDDPLVEGVILAPLHLDQSRLLSEMRTPIVVLGECDADAPLAWVGFDNEGAAYMLTHHLIEQGYRRIGVVGRSGTDVNATALRRFEGYERAHREAGLRTDSALAPVYPPVAYDRAVATQQASRLLGRRRPPDALLCLADVLAFGAIAAAHERGVDVPGDLGITGFDGLDEAINRHPTLTTVVPDIESMATAAVRARIEPSGEDPGATAPAISCEYTIVYGETTRSDPR
jgi:DNA-binding LacI/PurR family transcriptional regulator